jgi:hypothetical protein
MQGVEGKYCRGAGLLLLRPCLLQEVGIFDVESRKDMVLESVTRISDDQ